MKRTVRLILPSPHLEGPHAKLCDWSTAEYWAGQCYSAPPLIVPRTCQSFPQHPLSNTPPVCIHTNFSTASGVAPKPSLTFLFLLILLPVLPIYVAPGGTNDSLLGLFQPMSRVIRICFLPPALPVVLSVSLCVSIHQLSLWFCVSVSLCVCIQLPSLSLACSFIGFC